MGAHTGRTVLGVRDLNSGFIRSVSAMSFASSVEEKSTPGWKSSSYVSCIAGFDGRQPVASTLGHSTTRYPRRGRLTRLGPPKRTSRLSSDSMETPSEGNTPPAGIDEPDLSILSTIPSSGTEDIKGLKGLLKFQQQQGAVVNEHGEYTPPTSQPSPPLRRYEREVTPVQTHQESTQPEEKRSTPRDKRQSPRLAGGTPNENVGRRVSSSSTVSSNNSTRVQSTRSLGRSSLRNLLTSTSPHRSIDVALEGVQRGLEALTVRKEPTKVKQAPS